MNISYDWQERSDSLLLIFFSILTFLLLKVNNLKNRKIENILLLILNKMTVFYARDYFTYLVKMPIKSNSYIIYIVIDLL